MAALTEKRSREVIPQLSKLRVGASIWRPSEITKWFPTPQKSSPDLQHVRLHGGETRQRVLKPPTESFNRRDSSELVSFDDDVVTVFKATRIFGGTQVKFVPKENFDTLLRDIHL